MSEFDLMRNEFDSEVFSGVKKVKGLTLRGNVRDGNAKSCSFNCWPRASFLSRPQREPQLMWLLVSIEPNISTV